MVACWQIEGFGVLSLPLHPILAEELIKVGTRPPTGSSFSHMPLGGHLALD